MFKNAGALLLVLAMLLSLCPMAAFAEGGPVVTVATDSITLGERNSTNTKETLRTVIVDQTFSVGEEFYIPIKLTNMSEFNAFNLKLSYDSSVLQFLGAYNCLQYYNEDEEDYADFAKTLSYGTDLTVNDATAVITFAKAGAVSNPDNALPYNYLFFAKFKVLAQSATGTETISIASSNAAAGVSMTDAGIVDSDITYVSGTVKVEQAEAASTLSFVNGTTTVASFDSLEADITSVEVPTAPVSGYVFVGWFNGLTATDNIVLENGYYVLKDSTVNSSCTIPGTEVRPRYDTPTVGGEYQALWLYDDGDDEMAFVLATDGAGTAHYLNQTIGGDAGAHGVAYSTVLKNAISVAADHGRVKLLQDMLSDLDGSTYGTYGYQNKEFPLIYLNNGENLTLDINGYTLGLTAESKEVGGPAVRLGYYSGNGETICIESSRSGGVISANSSYTYGSSVGIYTNRNTTITYVRDVTITAAAEKTQTAYAISNSEGTIGQISNCTISATGVLGTEISEGTVVDAEHVVAIYSGGFRGTIGTIDGCTITSDGSLIKMTYGPNSNNPQGNTIGCIQNTTMNSTAGGSLPAIATNAEITFGDNVTVTGAQNELIGGYNSYNDGYYSATSVTFTGTNYNFSTSAADGVVLGEDIQLVTPPASMVAENDGNSLAIVPGYTITYLDVDGTLLTKQSAHSDAAVAGYTPSWPRNGLNGYILAGWSLTNDADDNLSNLVDLFSIRADTALYAVRQPTTFEVAVEVTKDDATTQYAFLEDALSALGTDGYTATLKLFADVEGNIKVGNKQFLTLDLNGHVFTATGRKDQYCVGMGIVALGENWSGRACGLTITDTSENRGKIVAGQGISVALIGTSRELATLTIENVDVELIGIDGVSAAVLISENMYNDSGNVNTVILNNAKITCDTAPAIKVDHKDIAAAYPTTANLTITNSEISGKEYAIGVYATAEAYGSNLRTNITFTDAATRLKGAAPIQTEVLGLTVPVTYPTGYGLIEIGDGWYGFVPALQYDDGEAKSLEPSLDPVITETDVESITIKNAESLGSFHSLTVKNDGVELVFSAEALQSIASAATGDVVLTLKKTAGVDDTELNRVQLTLTAGGNPVAFTGAVDVTVKGLSFDEGKDYAVYYVNGAELEMIASAIDKTAGTAAFTTTHFSDYAIKSVEGYKVTVNPDKTDYNAGETVTVEYKISKSEATKLNGFQFKLAYDDTKLELVSLTVGSDFTGGEMTIDGAYVAGTPGTMEIPAVEINSTEKLLATATFTVKSTIPTFTTDSLTLTGMYFKNAGFDKDIEGVIAPVTVNLHNLKITLKSDGHGTINGAKDDVVLYAKYGETGLYSDEARTTAASITEGVDYGYQLLDKHWIDNAATPVEWADFAAIAAQPFNGEQADVYTLQTVQQVSIQIDTAQNATTSDTFTNPIVTTKGTKLGDVAGIPNYTPNDYHTADGWYVSTDAGETYTKLAVAKTDDAFRNYVINGNIKLYYKAVPASYTYTSNVAEKTLTGITEKEGVKYATYGTEVVATFESDDSKIIDKVSVKIGDAAATEEYSSNAAGVWTVKIPAASVTGDITVEVTTKDIYTITFTNGTGVKPLSATAYVLSGVPTYYASVAELKAATSTFTIPAPEADTGYRLADQSGEKLWKIGEDGFTASELAGKTYTANATVTAQAVKTFVVTFAAGEHGTITATQITVDKDSTVEAALTSAPAVTAEAGYEFTEWSPKTGTITADTTITAQYQDAKYDLTLSAPTGVTVEATAGEEGGKVTHGTDAVIKVTVPEGQKVTEISYFVDGVEHTVTLAEPISGPADYSFTIPGAEITGPVSVIVKGNATKVVTFKAGANGTVGGGASVTKVYDVGASIAAADLPAVKANAGYKFDKWDKEPTGFQVTESATEADLTFTATFTDASYSLIEDGKQKPDVTHGTDYDFTPNPDEGVVVGVVVTVEDEDGNPVPITPVKNDDGSYTIPGDKITGPVVITYQTVNGAFRFIDYDTYRALDTDTKIAVLETAFQDGKNYSLDGYRIAYYSDGEGYKGYIWIVDDSETVASLSAKLSVTDGTAAEKITYQDGDLNDSSRVTATDAGIINDVLRHVATVYTVSDQLRFELDILGDGAVTTQDIMWVLNKAIEVAKG